MLIKLCNLHACAPHWVVFSKSQVEQEGLQVQHMSQTRTHASAYACAMRLAQSTDRTIGAAQKRQKPCRRNATGDARSVSCRSHLRLTVSMNRGSHEAPRRVCSRTTRLGARKSCTRSAVVARGDVDLSH